MPRLARLDTPGALHHIMIRGIERRSIFKDNKDRDNLLERLSNLLPETKTSCYAWALMPNHAHFLFQSGPSGISTLMGRLLTGYAVSFNRRHKRHGHLFQNRYKSIICQEDLYLKELVRYIHLNPLRVKTVKDIEALNSYLYCGHSVLMGKQSNKWQDVKYVFSCFGRTFKKARSEYYDYVDAGVTQGRRPELIGGGLIRSLGGWDEVKKIRLKGQDRVKSDERILGESDFVMDVLAEADEEFNRPYELKRLGIDLDKIEQKVLKIYGIDRDELYSRGRRKTQAEARSLLCYWAVCELGFSRTYMSKRLMMTQPGVGYAISRGERIANENKYNLVN